MVTTVKGTLRGRWGTEAGLLTTADFYTKAEIIVKVSTCQCRLLKSAVLAETRPQFPKR
jgi:hypothetical protein